MSRLTQTTLGEISNNFDNVRVPLSVTEREKLVKKYRYYGAQGVIDYVDDYLFDGEYILVAEDGENLKSQKNNICNFVTGKFWVNNHAHILNASNGHDTKYLYYKLSLVNFKNYVTGSAQPKLTKDNLNSIVLHIHKDIEQKKIAAVLSALDAKIDCNNRINAELEAMAKTLYDYWFVQFDFPFDFAQGKPDANGKPYQSSGGKMVYNATLKREIPEGWDMLPLSDWIANDKTGDWGRDTAEGNYTLCVDCIRGADINGLNGTGTAAPPTRFILEKNAAKILAPFNFVIEISGGSPSQSTGRLALITEEAIERFSRPLICSNFCKAISLKNSVYAFNFSYLWKSAYDSKVLFGWEGKTSGIKNLLFDAFTTKHLVSKPPQKLAKRFFEIVAPMEVKKQKLLQETADLAALRDWLLPLLMNGQVTVA